jgi:hypothetical protein
MTDAFGQDLLAGFVESLGLVILDLGVRGGLDPMAPLSRRLGRWQARRVLRQQARNLWPLFRSAVLKGIPPGHGAPEY